MKLHAHIPAAVAVCCFLLCPRAARSQYYDWGQDPASIKWEQVEGENGRLVFPDYYRRQALRMMNYMDTLRGRVGFGFRHGPMKIPLVLHTQNFSTNGLVMLAPARMEFIVTPPASTFAMPWYKQLAVHEYRHAVQYSNTNRNFVRVLSRILGQQGALVGIAQLPYWMVEGDAVLTETEFSSFGRGVQPSFTIDYRAMLAEGVDYRPDKFFSGSYKDHLPDHYTLGYHITRYAYDKYGENIWDRVSWFNSRNPYMIFPTSRALRKFYGTGSTQLFRETFERLAAHWASVPEQEDSPRIIPTRTTSFTTYQTPVRDGEGNVYALKTDLDRTTRIVRVDPESGTETVLARTGAVNTGLVAIDGKLWWTELRQSTFWEQRVGSQLCWFDPADGTKGTRRDKRHVLFPTESRGDGDPSYAEYRHEGYYAIVTPEGEYTMPDTLTVHGLTYDRITDAYYIIGLSDAGMWLGRVDEKAGGAAIVHGPTWSALSDLRADGGALLYSSIATGRDEAHRFDLSQGKEYVVTASRYGSFSPAPGGEGLLVTTYTSKGYLLAVQQGDNSPQEEIAPGPLPRSFFNPPGLRWDVMNVDTLSLGSDDHDREVKRFRKGSHQFQFHSWAPFWFEPDRLMEEDRLNVYFGATALSQNLLNSAFSTFGYKYTDAGSLFTAGMKFYGWAPKFEIDAEVGTMKQYYNIFTSDLPAPPRDQNYYMISGRVSLPMLLGSGNHVRWLTPSFEVVHQNDKYYKFLPDGNYRYGQGVQKFRLSLMYSENARLAHKDFLPRLGYALRISHTFTPLNELHGGITSLYGRLYLPGIGRHHSLMLRGALQKQSSYLYNFKQKEIFPRGADYFYAPDKYSAFTVDYQLPLCYPDGGINSVLYFRRIRANLFFDYSYFRVLESASWSPGDKKFTDRRTAWKDVYSYGIDLTFDMVPFRLPPNTNTAFTVSVYISSDRNKPVFEAGLVLPL